MSRRRAVLGCFGVSIVAVLAFAPLRQFAANRVTEVRLRSKSFTEIQSAASLHDRAIRYGKVIFQRNTCSNCHGASGEGNRVWCPPLRDDEWIWGGTDEDIFQTIKYGVRQMELSSSPVHPLGVPAARTRYAIMPRFDSVMKTEEIADVADYVRALVAGKMSANAVSGDGVRADTVSGPRAALARGSRLFAQHCASCHGQNGVGGRMRGVPRLVRHAWIEFDNPEYLEDYIAVGGYVTTSRDNRVRSEHFSELSGMPSWGNPLLGLRDGQIKAVTLYLKTLRRRP